MPNDDAARPLTPKQDAFCREYLIDLDATAAAKRAGYSERSAAERGYELRQIPSVQRRIAELQAERAERTNITADRVLQELALIAFSNLDDFAEWGGDVDGINVLTLKPSRELTRAQKAVIKSVKHTRKRGKTDEDTLEIVREDKLSALDKLAKHLNLYGEHGDDGKRSGLDDLVESMAALRAQRDTLKTESED